MWILAQCLEASVIPYEKNQSQVKWSVQQGTKISNPDHEDNSQDMYEVP